MRVAQEFLAVVFGIIQVGFILGVASYGAWPW